jgi:NadR type nicotinamide-nucleotide adenylyltransferase
LIKKIVLFGSESTGKTTLAQQLAAHYQTVWVPEYSRIYQEQQGYTPALQDVIPIAKGQMHLEDLLILQANRILICDTDILETKVYSDAYNGTSPEWLLQKVPERYAHLYLLTDIDLPWEPDGIRDRPDNRQEMHKRFKLELVHRNLLYVEISGNYRERFLQAVQAIDVCLKTNS